MKFTKIISKIFIHELLIILGVLVLVHTYFGEEQKTIKSDGKGYYDYLPGIFIYKDISFNYYDKVNAKYYSPDESEGLIKEFKGKRVSKYPIGSALLWTPFFTASHIVAINSKEYKANGYSTPYQKGVYYAALFYLFIGLLFLRKLLLFYNLSRLKVFLVQIMIVFGTPLMHYTYYDPSFSHVYSFFAITVFLYLIKHYLTYNRVKMLFAAGLFLGLIFLLRQINILIILFIPFLIGNFNQLKVFLVKHFYYNPSRVLLFFSGFILIASIQFVFNKIQSGYFFVYSYGEEGFNFLKPMFFESWFGFGKGFFIYTPLAFIGVLGIVLYGIRKKKWMLISSFILFIVAVNYIFSSWWCWFYGYSYSLRPWVDFLSIFGIGLLFIFKSKYAKFILIPLASVCIYINIIQMYQYNRYILHWGVMDYSMYKKVFLHTEPMYQGYFFREKYMIGDYAKIQEFKNQEIFKIEPTRVHILLEKELDKSTFEKLKLVRVWLPNDINNQEEKVFVTIRNKTGELLHHHTQSYFHKFEEDNNATEVYFDYLVPNNLFENNELIDFQIGYETFEKEAVVKGVRVELYKSKND